MCYRSTPCADLLICRFLLSHFASSFTVTSITTPPKEEKWISSATMRESSSSNSTSTLGLPLPPEEFAEDLKTGTLSITPRVSRARKSSSSVRDPGSTLPTTPTPDAPEQFSGFMHKFESPPKTKKKVLVPWRI
jgi:hypothetical protein